MPPPNEVTPLSPEEAVAFQRWIEQNRTAPGIATFDAPEAHYDMRGFWKDQNARAQWTPGEHFPDTYKQHGHPTFSQESQYSAGPADGGMWVNDTFLAQPPLATAHVTRQQLAQAVRGAVQSRLKGTP